jgi:hypothetical protein
VRMPKITNLLLLGEKIVEGVSVCKFVCHFRMVETSGNRADTGNYTSAMETSETSVDSRKHCIGDVFKGLSWESARPKDPRE